MRRYLEAEPGLYENQALVLAPRRAEYERLLDGLRRLFARCEPPGCTAALLVVPHESQVDPGYLRVLERIGARFADPSLLADDNYPFLALLREELARLGPGRVRILDALPALRDVERDRHAFFLHDPHLNACGQEALADLVLSDAPLP